MNSKQRVTLLDKVQSHHAAIANAWYQALKPTGFSPLPATQLRRRLGELTESVLLVLLSDPFDDAAAEVLGGMLADLGFTDPTSLRTTLEVLADQLIAVVGDPEARLLTRLTHFQAAFAAGFVAAVRKRAMAEQEHNMAALLAAHKEAEAARRITEHHLCVVAKHVPLILFVVDTQGIVTFAMGRSLGTLGITSARIVGQSIRDAARNQPEVIEYVEAALAGEAFTAIVDVDGRNFETRYAPYSDETGTIVGVIGVALDVTERTQLQERLVELRQQAGRDAQGALVDPRTIDLTPDDLVLLRLLAEGQTNRQIGAALGVSSKAIEKRLTKLFARLGINTRTEAAAWAARANLV